MAGSIYDPRYEFKVPEFTDFNLVDQLDQTTELEEYFDFDHENGVPLVFGSEVPAELEEKPKPEKDTKLKPRRSLRNTDGQKEPVHSPTSPPAKCVVASEAKVDVSLYATPAAKSGPATLIESSAPLAVEMPKHHTRSQSHESQQNETTEAVSSASSDSTTTLPNLCSSLSEWNKKSKTSRGTVERKPSFKKPSLVRTGSMSVTKKVMSTEEQELEKIKQLREDVATKRRIAQESLERARSSTQLPTKTTQEVTKAKAFSFATDKRVSENKTMPATAADHQNFTAMLRHYEPLKTQRRGPTVPIDTSLYTRKRKHASGDLESHNAESLPLWSKTPDRFHSQPKGTKFVPSNKRRRSRSMDCKITLPVTPKLESRKRTRHVHVVSQKEIDEKAVEEVARYRFRARPVNGKIFESNCMGVPRKEAKEPTVAVSPNFQTGRRRKDHIANVEDLPDCSFHARPIPKGMFKAPQGVKEVTHKPLTQAQSPAFSLQRHVRSMDSESSNESDHIIRANRMPDLNKKFEVKIQKSVVRMEPFSFDERDQAIPLRKQQLAMEEELRREKAREFKARKPDVLKNRGFKPQPSSLPLTDITDHRLNTDLRSVERGKWESKKAETERELAQVRADAEKQRQDKEKEEVERIRREAVHKAQPVRHFQQTIVQRSTNVLTTAQSPCFATAARLRARTKNS